MLKTNSKIKPLLVIGMVLILAIAGAGCATDQSEGTQDNTDDNHSGTDTTDNTKQVSIAYVQWDDAIATTNVVKQVYEKAGYDVKMNSVAAGAMYQAIASGNVDFSACGWLPNTQANYWEEYGDQIDKVGPNLEGASTGLVVPTYMDIDSIEELNENKEKLDGKITGIDPGAGIMSQTDTAIQEYNLDYELMSSSSAGMASALKSAYDNKEPIVVTLWNPHWAFARWDLKYLDDPKSVYGEDQIVNLARQGMSEDKPEAYEILNRIEWSMEDVESVMADIQSGTPAEEAASKWIENNPEKVDYWINGEQ
ncbi:glycine betaine ABC transporter substrate-binding protein [Methanohalobium sp.]|uniref:glycine betaine ABC transporter substrate-binding protein n=1 Tax=Methanohalobium sp. TaxID=2837493 RepID=UPI0025E7B347|nr:glycine betaine ABC transporter substrate-binding protein [Methanohalobium sp.]